ncbi:MAG TPA: PAAR domain-containing protein, partial [Symbiobacteriaceae bacterium]|nr:PAAR domain-containing protein [Symbiobacteriaceae bacterium]
PLPMGMPAAKQGDQVLATDTHIIMIPGTPPVPTPLPHPFTGMLTGGLISTVTIGGMPAAVAGSTADNLPPHIPQGGPFQKPPANSGSVLMGSSTVFIGGKPAARQGDTAMTCNDPADMPVGTVIAAGTVMIGG